MDSNKVGKLIKSIRKEKNMTQKQIAQAMNISDKTISKWERGLGFPDVSLLADLSKILGVNIEQILTGDINSNEIDGGNMKKIKFYVCKNCGSIINSTGEAEISCCGRKLEALVPKPSDEKHHIKIEEVEFDYYITFNHEMTKNHHISFVAYVVSDRVLLIKQYPEQTPAVRFPQMSGRLGQKFGGRFYYYCTEDGLYTI